MAGPEATIERTICREAEKHGWLVRKLTFLGVRGAPDRIFGRGGKTIVMEFKRLGAVPTQQQLKRHRELTHDFGWVVYVCDNLADARWLLGLPEK